MGKSIESICTMVRDNIQEDKEVVARLLQEGDFAGYSGPLSVGNVPRDQVHNMKANITLAFRHLKDARMRLGKVMQAAQGGVSILDRKDEDVDQKPM